MIDWQKLDSTTEEMELISKILDRAISMGLEKKKLTGSMDISAVHGCGCKLDLDKFYKFEAIDFIHDYSGIKTNIDRETGKLGNYFLPRCAVKDAGEVTLTKMELKVLKAYKKDQYVNDYGWESERAAAWIDGFAADAGIASKSFPGVISSLVKKKIVGTDGKAFWLTDLGRLTAKTLEEKS